MSNFKITMHMGSPVGTIGYVYLDGILFRAAGLEMYGEDYINHTIPLETFIPAINERLATIFDTRYGVLCASVGFGENKEYTDSWSKRWDDVYDDVVKFNEKTKARVDVASGSFKNYHMPFMNKAFKDVIFYARGNATEIERLLRTYIFSIGKKCSQGKGEILSMGFEEMEEDYSLFKGEIPMRAIPTENYPKYMDACIKNNRPFNIQTHPVMPPYWSIDNLKRCYMPV